MRKIKLFTAILLLFSISVIFFWILTVKMNWFGIFGALVLGLNGIFWFYCYRKLDEKENESDGNIEVNSLQEKHYHEG